MAVFALAFSASCFGLWSLKPIGRRGALRRIDEASGLEHRPASTVDDKPATAGRDPATDALWALHLRRTEAQVADLKAGAPSPRSVDLDRYAVRAGLLAALVACAIVAGPQRYARIAGAFDFGGLAAQGETYRLDAWIDPPSYTGKAPALLDLASGAAHDASHPLRITAPVGSIVFVRATGGVEIETSGPLLAPAKPQGGPGKNAEAEKKSDARPANGSADDGATKLVLHGDSKLTLRHNGALLGAFEISAIPDLPPTIELREIPKHTARGSLTLAYTLRDDYGVASAEALFAIPKLDGVPVGGTPLVEAPHVELSLPGLTHGIGDADTTADLSDHPWAGAQVRMVLSARDEGGNEGRSEPVEVTLPQKPFQNPLARALVEQRRLLVLSPDRRADVAAALDALMVEPEAFGTTAGVYLGLRYASDSLAQAQTRPDLVAVADFLWGMALQIENGDLSDAEKALRNAEKELRDAIERHASDQDIQKLTQNLQAAMDKFLKELAQQQNKQGDQAEAAGRQGKAISARDLQKLIDRLKEQARSGNREEAKRALDELQDILENLRTARRQKADPQARAMAESLNQLDQMMRDQQDLRDETYKRMQQQDHRRDEAGEDDGLDQMPPSSRGKRSGGRTQGRSPDGQGESGQGAKGNADGGREQSEKGLSQRQQDLRDRLAAIQKKLKQAGRGAHELGEAADSMQEAEGALKDGEGSSGQAVDAQGRALDALQQGAKKLAQAMQQQGNGEGGQSSAEGQGAQEGEEGQQTGEADPLGRPRGTNALNAQSRLDLLGVPAAQRAQRVLEELRRRLADPTRAQEEIDYLERLLRSY